MENRKAVLDLKDVPPPPPHHISSSQPSQSFPLTSLSLLPPCLPRAQITQDSRHRQLMSLPPPPKQEGASPKVSICAHCDHCRTEGYGLLGAGGGVGSGSSISGVPVEIPTSLGLHLGSGFSRCGSCSITSHNLSSRSEGVPDPLLGCPCKPQALSTVATSQSVLSHPHHPCCPAPLHTYSPAPFPGSKTSTCTFSTPLAPSFPCISSLPTTLHSSSLDSFNHCSYGVDCCPAARRSKRNTHGDSLTTTNTTAHFCSNPLHLNVERTGCLKGAHLCQECMLKVGYISIVSLGVNVFNFTIIALFRIVASSFLISVYKCVCSP